MNQTSKRISLILIGIMAFVSLSMQAQQTTLTYLGYYIAPDTDGIEQVFQLVLGEEHTTRQLTHTRADVNSFGIAYDGLSVAYVSESQLWLQPIHTEEPEALTTINTTEFVRNPVFSPDSQYIAYADNGVWLLDLSTHQTRQLLENVPFTPDSESVGELRTYAPDKFIWGTNGEVAQLVVEIGMWEWVTAGIYDLSTGELQINEEITYTDLLPLYGGRVLIYGNNAMNGNPVLRVAVDGHDISINSEVLSFSDLIDNVITLFASQGLEIAPGTVRILGTVFSNEPEPRGFYIDYNLMSNEVLSVSTFAMPVSESSAVEIAPMSTDGALIPIYDTVGWRETGGIFGHLSIFDLASGEEIISVPDFVSNFQWQP